MTGKYYNQFSKNDKLFPIIDKQVFIDRIEKSDHCWGLKSLRPTKGYRFFWVKELKVNIIAHRFSFWIFNGSIDSNLVIDHKCRNKWCINPDHLRNVSMKINAIENSNSDIALNHAKTHCKNGHPLFGENLSIKRNGFRRCLTCHRECEAKRRRK